MTIPDIQTMMLPLLRLHLDGKEHSIQAVGKRLAKEFSLSEEEISALQSGQKTTFTHLVEAAGSYLVKARLLEITRQSYCRITARGLDTLESDPARIDLEYLEQFPEFVESQAKEIADKKGRESKTPHETKRKSSKLTAAHWAAIGLIGAAVFTGLFGTITAIINRMPTPVGTSTPSPSETIRLSPSATFTVSPQISHTPSPTFTPVPTNTPTSTPITGKHPGEIDSFSVNTVYDPSGYMGDTGDITIGKQTDSIIFTYVTQGNGPHEWDYKYLQGTLNTNPARFAGVMLLEPPNCWGTLENCGYDLRGFKKIRWEARSLGDDVYVEFIIGGVLWQWDDTNKIRVAVPYPETLPRISLGVKHLTSQTQSFEYDISYLPEDDLRKVIGAFGWTITWDANGVKKSLFLTGPEEVKIIIIEVSNIVFER